MFRNVGLFVNKVTIKDVGKKCLVRKTFHFLNLNSQQIPQPRVYLQPYLVFSQNSDTEYLEHACGEFSAEVLLESFLLVIPRKIIVADRVNMGE